MTGPVQIVGLDAFRKELRKLEDPKAWSKELGAAHRKIGREAAAKAQGAAQAMGGPQRHFAKKIKGYGTVQAARVGISNPVANAAFWGAKQRTGWNARNQAPNQPQWITNSWDVADPNAGPYAINPALHRYLPEVLDTYGDALGDITRRAFPD